MRLIIALHVVKIVECVRICLSCVKKLKKCLPVLCELEKKLAP